MLRVDRELAVARRHVVLFKILVDLARHGEPEQRVRPQIAEVGLMLPRGVVRAGQTDFGIGLQRIVQLDDVAVRIGELRRRSGRCGKRKEHADHKQDAKDFPCSFHNCPLLQ